MRWRGENRTMLTKWTQTSRDLMSFRLRKMKTPGNSKSVFMN